MANKVFVVLSNTDREVALEAGLLYPLMCAKNKWMDEVKLFLFGPAEKLAAYDTEIRERIGDIMKAGVEVQACKYCADRMNITPKLEEMGIKVVYIGPVISQLLKEGWASLTF